MHIENVFSIPTISPSNHPNNQLTQQQQQCGVMGIRQIKLNPVCCCELRFFMQFAPTEIRSSENCRRSDPTESEPELRSISN